jgi:LysR family hydrogen peroxide-inducible transcriptional activator
MEIHQLQYFVSVAEMGNFTRAAEKCLVAQPSLSQQIKKLEKELGHPLIERLNRGIRLTDAGRIFYDKACHILDSVEEAKREITDERDENAGRITVGAIPTIAPYLLPAVLKKFSTRFPKAEVVLRENFTEFTIKGCLEGDLDLGILALPVEQDHLVVTPLFTEELLLAINVKHPFAKKKRITMKDVSDEPFILLNETHCLGEQVLSFCKQRDCLPRVACESSQLLTAQEMVALNHGISLIPEMAASVDSSKKRIYRSLSGVKPTRTIAMAWHKHRYQSQLVKKFIEELQSYALQFV